MPKAAGLKAMTMPMDANGSPSPLHICLMGMVLVNVLFVQLTGAAPALWLIPLYALTLASPILAQFRDRTSYRALWNWGVIAFLGLLIQHATSRNLEYVLQDGLILSVLCQVHLLNNMRVDQRTDLLFLNSFLIAIITAYITVDLGFAAAFLLYAPFFIIGMQLQSMTGHGVEMPKDQLRAVLWDGARRSGALLGLALLVFLFWPRDFNRGPMFAQYFDLSAADDRHEIGFSERLQLQKHTSVEGVKRIVLTVQPSSGNPADIPELWRGATLSVQGGDESWKGLGRPMRSKDPVAEKPWRNRQWGLSRLKYSEAKRDIELRVTRFDSSTLRLFLPRTAARIRLDEQHTQGRLTHDGDGTVSYSNLGTLHYSIELASPIYTEESTDAPSEGLIRSLQTYLRLHPRAINQGAIPLAQKLRNELPSDASSTEIVDHFSAYLQRNYSYRFPGDPRASGSLEEFLTTDNGGHCEFFASALATMLRSTDIPCRLVTGFRSSDWDSRAKTRTFYNLDAHAWVEVFDAKYGWYSVDPTPAADEITNSIGLWAKAQDSLTNFWNRVTGFDSESRSSAMAWIKTVPARTGKALANSPWTTSSGLLIGSLILVCLQIRKRRRTPAPIRVFRRGPGKGWNRSRLDANTQGSSQSLRPRVALEGPAKSHPTSRQKP